MFLLTWFNHKLKTSMGSTEMSTFYTSFNKSEDRKPVENQNCDVTLCPTGYQKRTVQILRASHVCSIDNFVAFCLEWL